MSLDGLLVRTLLLTVGCFLATAPAQGADVYVDANATGPTHDGTSWCSAYLTLQEALESPLLLPPATVYMADGTYLPALPEEPETDLRKATFSIPARVRVRGGYAGCGATDPDERDLRGYETILSGDLDGDDYDGGDNSENCYHVVTVGGGSTIISEVQLDGVTITGGHADGAGFKGYGAGVLNNYGEVVTVRDCLVTANRAKYGGGVYSIAGNLTLEDSTIAGNVATNWGGGLYDTATGFEFGAKLVNCLLVDNKAGSSGYGGAVFSNGADTQLHNCTIYGNHAYGYGGLFGQSTHFRIDNTILWGNTQDFRGDESAQIWLIGGLASITNTCVDGWSGSLGGTDNFGDDPLFTPGPIGCYYLSQEEAGDAEDSPCLDAGSDTAANEYLDDRTTRSDEVTDDGMVDVGFHYPVTGFELLMGDRDHDGDVDQIDFAEFTECMTDPEPSGLSPCCRIFDLDYDDDVDLYDVAEFATAFTNP